MKITRTEERQVKKQGTKTVWLTQYVKSEEISERQHTNMVDAAPFMRRLGGSEYLEREYTGFGYLTTRIISTSPDKTERVIYRFFFRR